MGTTIEKQIVEMQFKNEKFESGIKTSISSLEKLKNKLDFKGAQKGLTELQNAGKSFSLSHMASAVDSIANRFSNLGIVGMTALQNLTNSAIEAGKNIVSALTIDPVKMGFQEYETQINAVQTILANTSHKGSTLEDVNAALDELNHYADKTIYNFTEMTKNIGTFTAAGVDLETSVKAIKGIANLAAISGSNSEQASRAMYQLSQAIAAGKVNLQDWNSVVNSGMGGKIFQDALVRTGKLMGANINAAQSFRESISAKDGTDWLTSDILLATLEQFTGDMTEAELAAQGFTKEQIKDIMQMGDTANKAATEVKTFTQLFDTLKEAAQSGWTQTWEIIVGDFEEAKTLMTDISNFVGDIINKSAEARNSTLEGWAMMGGREDLLAGLKNVFEGILSVITPIQEAFRNIFPPVTFMQLTNFTKSFKEVTENFKLSDENAEKLRKTFEGLFSAISIVKDVTLIFTKAGLLVLSKLLGVTGDNLLTITSKIGEAITKFREWLDINGRLNVGIEQLVKVLEFLKEAFDKFLKIPEVQSALQKVQSAFNETFSSVDKYISGGIKRIQEFVDRVRSMEKLDVSAIFKDFKTNVVDYFLNVDISIDKLKKVVIDFKNVVKEQFDKSLNSFLGFKDGVIEGVKTISSKLFNMISDLKSKFNGIGIGEILTVAFGASFILFVKKVSEAVDKLDDIFGSAGEIIKNFSDILDGVVGVLGAYKSKIKADAFKTIAEAIAIIAGALALLTLLDQEKLRQATITLGIVAAGLIAFSTAISALSKFDKLGNITGSSKSIMALSSSLLIIASTLKVMDSLDDERLIGHVTALGVIATGLSAFSIIISKFAPNMAKGSIFFISFSIAIRIMVGAFEELQKMDLNNAGKSLAVLAGLMTTLALVSNGVGKIKFGSSIGLLGIVSSLYILIDVLDKISEINTGKILGNMDALALVFGSMAVLIASTKFAGKNASKAGVAVILISSSLLIMVKAIKQIEEIDPASVNQAASVISKMLLVFGAVIALTNFAGPNAGKAGVTILAMSTSIVILSGAIALLSNLDQSKVDNAVNAILKLGTMFSVLVAATGLAKNVKGTILVLTGSIVAIGTMIALLSIIKSDNLDEATNAIIKVMGMFAIVVASTSLAKSVAPTVMAMTVAVVGIGAMIALLSKMPIENVETSADSISKVLLSLSISMGILSKMPITGALKSIGVLAVIIAGIVGIITVLGAINQISGFSWLMGEGAKVFGMIGNAIGSFIGGITGGILAESSKALPEIGKNLSDFMNNAAPFFNQLNSISDNSMNAVKTLAETILILTSSNIISGVASFFVGEKSLVDFGKELVEFGKSYSKYYESVKGIDANVVTVSSNAAKTIAEFANKLPNSGGLLAAIVGDNTLSDFAKELAKFGPSFKKYADSVSGISPEAVTASANAAKSLAELASIIPNEGGIVSWVVGDNTLSEFASGLAKFGPSFKNYADSISGLDTSVVSNTSLAVDTITKFGSLLSDSNNIFFDRLTVSEFGYNLEIIGSAFKEYYDTMKSIDGGSVSTMVDSLSQLVDVVNKMGQSNTESITKFKQSIIDLKTTVTTETANVVSTITTMISNSVLAISNKNESFKIAGRTNITFLIQGYSETLPEVQNKMIYLMNDIIRIIQLYDFQFKEKGKLIVSWIIQGLKQMEAELLSVSRSLIEKVVGEVSSKSNALYDVGVSLGASLADGLRSMIDEVRQAGKDLANAASNGAGDIDISGGGGSSGGGSYGERSSVRQVMTMSDISRNSKSVSTFGTNGVNLSNSIGNAAKTATSMNYKDYKLDNQTSKKTSSDPTVQFNQYNYSPKALSRIDIYRQTKNLLSQSKEKVATK